MLIKFPGADRFCSLKLDIWLGAAVSYYTQTSQAADFWRQPCIYLELETNTELPKLKPLYVDEYSILAVHSSNRKPTS